MKALYLAEGQSINDDVININGTPGTYGTLSDLTSTDTRFCWTSWNCCDAISTIDSSVTSIIMQNAGGSYTPVTSALVGGRPARPIAH